MCAWLHRPQSFSELLWCSIRLCPVVFFFFSPPFFPILKLREQHSSVTCSLLPVGRARCRQWRSFPSSSAYYQWREINRFSYIYEPQVRMKFMGRFVGHYVPRSELQDFRVLKVVVIFIWPSIPWVCAFACEERLWSVPSTAWMILSSTR